LPTHAPPDDALEVGISWGKNRRRRAASRCPKPRLEEELGITATIGDEIARIQHEYPNGGMVELRFYVVREFKGELENRIFKEIRWAELKELAKFDFLEADLTLVKDLAEGKLL
jgi:hypothetical protein